MNQDTLVLLSGMAPKEPEQWALDEWDGQFEKDYPKPWDFTGYREIYDASVACSNAYYYAKGFFVSYELLGSSKASGHLLYGCKSTNEYKTWSAWRDECLGEWTRNEWPLLWAKKRIQAAEVA